MKLTSKVFRIVFLSFLSLMLLSNIISLFFTRSLYTNEILQNLNDIMTLQKQNVDNRLIRLYELLIYPSYSDSIVDAIRTADPDEMDSAQKTELKERLENYFLLNIYIPARTYFYTATFKIAIDSSYPVSELFLSETQNIVSSDVCADEPNATSDIEIYRSLSDSSFLTFSRGILYRPEVTTPSPVYIGTVYITIHYTDLTDSLQNFMSSSDQNVFLIAPDGTTFGVQDNISDTVVNDALAESSNYAFDYNRIKSFDLRTRSANYLVQMIELNTNWQIMHMINYDTINSSTLPLILISLVSTVVMVLIIFLLSHRFIPSVICTPITKLSDTMQTIIASGDYTQEVKTENPCLEIYTLYTSFNQLLHQITLQIDEINRSNREKQEAELKLLQKMINPHFLYNTLDSIGFSVIGSHPQVANSIATLSDLLRYATYEPYKLVTLDNEIDNIRKYIQIQNFCYSMDIKFTVKSRHADTFYLPKLTLQPLVENAIQHGIRECQDELSDPFIKLSTQLQDEFLVLKLENNGKDPDPDAIQKALTDREPTSNLGLYNVNARLRMQFGEKTRMEFSKRKGGGTVLLIYIPC